jgi:predicted nucleotide-binding protein (sugar kinase/HSP70/actin superfamily)
VLEEFQVLGYPILSMRAIPRDEAWLRRFFEEDLRKGLIESPLEIRDVWPENYSANSATKVWAAKFAARHPQRGRCSTCRRSSAATTRRPTASSTASSRTSATPYQALHDIDANKPGGSIKIRVKTYAHALKLHEERSTTSAAQGGARLLASTRSACELLRAEEGSSSRRGRGDPTWRHAQIEEIKTTVADLRGRRGR